MNMYIKETIKNTTLAISIIIIANLAMYILAFWTGSIRLIVNIDYFIPLLFLAFRKNLLFIFSFILISLYDFLMIFSQIFPFIRINDVIYLLKFSFMSSTTYKIYGLVLIFFLFFQIFFIIKTNFAKLNTYLLVLFNICILFYAFYVHFQENSGGKFWKPNEKQLVASQLVNYFEYRNKGFIKTYDMEGLAFQNTKIRGATKNLFDQNKIQNEKILLVINESWGVPITSDIQKNILKPLLNNSNIKNIKQSEVSFNGFTIAGELRELCQKVPNHFNLKNQTTGFENCLPHKFKNKGYYTVAVHGALGLMYDRQHWYPRAGFEKILFRDSGLNLPNSHCYSFPGNCDRDIAQRIQSEFKNNNNLFLYWLTLNTHAIYDQRDLIVDKFNCKIFYIKEDTASCRNLKLQAQFFDTLGNLINNPEFNGTRVIVVGDHAPPIIQSEKSVFKENLVPIIDFEINIIK